jgi:hypothetical protein
MHNNSWEVWVIEITLSVLIGISISGLVATTVAVIRKDLLLKHTTVRTEVAIILGLGIPLAACILYLFRLWS